MSAHSFAERIAMPAFLRKVRSGLIQSFQRLATETSDRDFDLGDRARDARDFGTAALHYQNGLRKAPSSWQYRVQLGHCLKETGNLDGAARSYFDALIIAPNDADLHIQLGHLHKMRQHSSEAKNFYFKALELGSRDPHAIHFLQQAQVQDPSLSARLQQILTDKRALKEYFLRLLPESERQNLLADKQPVNTLAQLILRYRATCSAGDRK